MSFFKEFKEDLNQAVNELLPGEELEEVKKERPEMVVNTLEEELDVKSAMDKLEGLFEKVEEPKADDKSLKLVKSNNDSKEKVLTKEAKTNKAIIMDEEPKGKKKEESLMNAEEVKENATDEVRTQPESSSISKEVSDEVTIITAGTSLTGNIESKGSLEISGSINGNVQCNGKLTVTGVIKGNSQSAEFFADSAKMEGEIKTDGTVKIGLGSVVIGNITAGSAVIAGAIKGDIDVQGPVVVDTSAVIMGNIKSRSVQINNGAVIEGFCSQSYADVDISKLFEDK